MEAGPLGRADGAESSVSSGEVRGQAKGNEREELGTAPLVFWLFLFFSAMFLAGFMPELRELLPFAGWVALLTSLGAIGGGLRTHDLWGVAGGALSGLLIPFFVTQYFALRADHPGAAPYVVEFLVPLAFAAIPGAALIRFGRRRGR